MMNAEKTDFDLHQGHGDHLESIMDDFSIDDLLASLPDLLTNAEFIAVTEEAISCRINEGGADSMRFILLQNSLEPLHLTMLLGVDPDEGTSQLITFYPEYDGSLVPVTLTAVHEWANGVEATIVGTFSDNEHPIAFFDTRYAINKNQYVLGKTYNFRIAALAFNAAVVQEPNFQFTGEEAVLHRERFGTEQLYDEDGNPEPLVINTTSLVAMLQTSKAYPHVGEYRSPVFEVTSTKIFTGAFLVLTIAITRTEDGDAVMIPLVTKQSFFPEGIQEGDPVHGAYWLQGYWEK